MGKLEKVVVLTVLFLVAVILGVSLNAEKGVAEASGGPMTARRGTTPMPPVGGDVSLASRTPEEDPPARAGNRKKRAAQPPEEPREPKGPTGVLSATIGGEPTSEPPAVEVPEEQPETAAFIRTLTGLEPSLSEDMMIYSWKHGDTFTSLADVYYGSRLHVSRLRSANEDRQERDLIAGDLILVPVLPPIAAEVGNSGETAAWEGGSTYVVQSGDVLGTISQTVYGTSKSWRKIYDANRDVLANPNSLTVGTTLRIPE